MSGRRCTPGRAAVAAPLLAAVLTWSLLSCAPGEAERPAAEGLEPATQDAAAPGPSPFLFVWAGTEAEGESHVLAARGGGAGAAARRRFLGKTMIGGTTGTREASNTPPPARPDHCGVARCGFRFHPSRETHR